MGWRSPKVPWHRVPGVIPSRPSQEMGSAQMLFPWGLLLCFDITPIKRLLFLRMLYLLHYALPLGRAEYLSQQKGQKQRSPGALPIFQITIACVSFPATEKDVLSLPPSCSQKEEDGLDSHLSQALASFLKHRQACAGL